MEEDQPAAGLGVSAVSGVQLQANPSLCSCSQEKNSKSTEAQAVFQVRTCGLCQLAWLNHLSTLVYGSLAN